MAGSDNEILEYVKNLNDHQLRVELGKNGIKAGPLTLGTRRIWKNRLAKKLGVYPPGENSARCDDPKASSQSTPVPALSKVVQQAQVANKYENEKRQFYGVFIPRTGSEAENFEPLVCESKSEILLTTKGHKEARFKAFSTKRRAMEYSLKGDKNIEPKNRSTKVTEPEDIRDKFPSLSQRDLNGIMRSIENGTWDEICNLFWSNPKYLVSADDGPVILKQRPRYNALHIAAKANQPNICREILSLLENREFQNLLFPLVSDDEAHKRRTDRLLDVYLNMPEKMLYETPLHLACKLGYKEVVSVLVAYPQCSAILPNASGKMPSEIVCSRASVGMIRNRSEIHQLLGDQYYVPLFRYHDNSEIAVVGTPIMSKQKIERVTPLNHLLQTSVSSPGTSSPPPSLVLSAFAGPMSKEQACQFRESWMRPTKRKDIAQSVKFLRRSDSEKGDEQIGRQLAANDDVRWMEFWNFLDDFANFATEEGLQKLDIFLQEKMSVSVDVKPSISRDISQLTDMLCDMHLSEDGKHYSVITNQIDSFRLKSNGSSSFGVASDYVFPSPNSLNRTKATQTMNINSPNVPPMSNTMRPFNDDVNITQNTSINADLVKKLFTNDENSVEKFAEDFSKNLSLVPKHGNISTPNAKGLTNEALLEYRSADYSHSDEFSSTSNSDSQISSLDTATVPHHPQNVFLSGYLPTKLDRDVLVAIGSACTEKFPSVSHWRDCVLSFPESERQKWGTPQKKREFSFNFSSPIHLEESPRRFPYPSCSPRRSNFTPAQDLRRLLFLPSVMPNAH